MKYNYMVVDKVTGWLGFGEIEAPNKREASRLLNVGNFPRKRFDHELSRAEAGQRTVDGCYALAKARFGAEE